MKALMTLGLLGALALQDKADLKVGDAAPAFEAKDDAGKDWKSSDHVGKKTVVVFFFPAAFTGGWTNQVRAFRDAMKAFEERGAEVLGVSGDTVKTQEAFKASEKLNFTLLSDEKGEVAKAFGVPAGKGGTVKKKIVDKDEEFTRGCSIKRWTFVIGKDGKIAYKNTDVKPADDAKTVLENLK